MNKPFSTIVISLVAVLAIAASVLNIAVPRLQGPQTFGAVNMISDRNFINAFGSASSPATLTQSYATSSAMRIQGLSNLVLAGTYTPKSHNSVLYLAIERSVDYGQTYYPYQTITPSTDRVSVWSNNFVTSSNAVPYVIPGSLSAASGTAITFSFDATVAGDYVRVAAKEYTTSTAGTFNVQLFSTNH